MITVALYGIPDPTGNGPGDLHDHNVTIMEDGKVLSFFELERISGKKHDNTLPSLIEDLLISGQVVLPKKFRLVYVDSFAGRRFASSNELIVCEADEEDVLYESPQRARGFVMNHDVDVYVCNHELAHIGTSLPFVGCFKDNSLLIHIDGGASNSNCSAWHYKDDRLNLLAHSWEFARVTKNFNLNPLSIAILGLPKSANLEVGGKLMGYAAYGTPNPELMAWLRMRNWFQDSDDELEEFKSASESDFGIRIDEFNNRSQYFMDIAACMQKHLEDSVEEYIRKYQKKTGASHLYYSGGVALNIKANSKLEKSGLFESMFVPPCCNDGGLSLGAAAIFDFLIHGEIEQYGPFLNSFGLSKGKHVDTQKASEIAEMIASEMVVGICTGNGEAGPRALGHRSILGSPLSLEIRDRISTKIKGREWYRPVGPSVLKSQSRELFEDIQSSNLAAYMLGSYTVKANIKHKVPGVVHVDGTSRPQVVDEDDPDLELYAAILTHLNDKFEIPCVINTSFNQSGKPLVHDPSDAIIVGREIGLDAVVFHDQIAML